MQCNLEHDKIQVNYAAVKPDKNDKHIGGNYNKIPEFELLFDQISCGFLVLRSSTTLLLE